ncbi:uncharacterized protein LOC141614399 [Silene latifolia]|uniref:uncharacterized protein LOC141614399 n=1 Tax=Silene latifolia TaxID=37657 RepID=UPI003D77C2E2
MIATHLKLSLRLHIYKYNKPFVLLSSKNALICCAYRSSRAMPSSKVCGDPLPVSTPIVNLSDGRQLAYKEQGVPKDEAIYKAIVVHGFDSSKDLYLPLSKDFVEKMGLYIVTIDRPGYGESDPNPKRTIKSDTFDVQELADHLNLGSKFYVVGLSLGNYITWGFIKYLPHRLAGAALVVPVVNYWWPSFPSKMSKEAYKMQPLRDQIKLWIAHNAPGLLHWWMTQSLLPSSILDKPPMVLNAKDVETMQKMALVPNLNEHKIRQQGEDESLYRDLKVGFGKWEFDPMELKSPFEGKMGSIHLWQGYQDRLVPYQLQRFLAKKLPWIKYHEVTNGGHLIIHDHVLCEEIFKCLLLD